MLDYLLSLYSLLYIDCLIEPYLLHYHYHQEKIHLKQHPVFGLCKPIIRIQFMSIYITRIGTTLLHFLLINTLKLAYHIFYTAIAFFLSDTNRVPIIQIYHIINGSFYKNNVFNMVFNLIIITDIKITNSWDGKWLSLVAG